MRSSLKTASNFFYTHRVLQTLTAVIVYIILTVYYYLGNTVTSCSDTLPTGIGDGTAGLIWLDSVSPGKPWWGFTYESNFPFGEQLGQPFHILGQAIYIPFWFVTKLVGPVCGYNLLTATGFVLSATIMFLFIRWLTKKSWIALLAGISVAFTPYLQYKTGLHPSYVFQGMFVGAIWLFLLLWRSPNKKLAIGLGAITALFFYTDPYFILLGGILCLGLLIFAVSGSLIGHRSWDFLLRRLKFLVMSLAVLITTILPIAYIQLKYSAEIKAVVSSSRSEINSEAEIYGARPEEYVLPNQREPLLGWLLGPAFFNRNQHGSNLGETQLSISITLLVIVASSLYIVTRKKIRRQKFTKVWSFQGLSIPFLLFVFSGTALLALLFSFPPKLGFIPTPNIFITHFTDIWRVFARLQVIVNICVVIVASIGLALWLKSSRQSPRLKMSIVVIVFIGVLFEYQSFFPVRETWTYKDAPPAYFWVKQQPDIKTIAEYPLDEPAKTIYPTYYFSYQILHEKNLLNASMPNSPQSVLRNALRDLDSPETLPSLRALGVDAILVHAKKDPGYIPGLQEVSEVQDANHKLKANEYVWAYKVRPGTTQDFILAPDTGFNELQVTSPTDVGYQTSASAQMLFVSTRVQTAKPKPISIGMDMYPANPGTRHVRVIQSGILLWQGDVTGHTPMNFEAISDPAKPLYLSVSGGERDKGIVIKQISSEMK